MREVNCKVGVIAIAIGLLFFSVFILSCAQVESHPEVGDSVQQEVIPEPCFDRIDYSRPMDYVKLPASIGDAKHIRTIAKQLKRQTPETTLRAIGEWMSKNLSYDPNIAYNWRNFDQIIEAGMLGGCADHSIVFGALSRACDIPTVWVKTMDYDWIRNFQRYGPIGSWRGHMFLEVYIQDRWVLLDAQGMNLYEDYDPTSHFFPGGRYAYDKGADPYEVILSVRWDIWKKQTADYFARFDVSSLPGFGTGRDISGKGVYIVADSPVWQWVQDACASQGYRVRKSFNTGFDKYLPEARGNILIVTCVGERLVLPAEYQDEYLPIPENGIKSKLQTENYGIARQRLDDGTKVILIFGRDNESIHSAIEALSVDETE
ncbi:MAG: transglutaminase domain-containing protein [Planctomycetota bacterium]|nr:MAG: transglutaminase domain-containing protein [Planctomycetota bacterium]